MVTFDFTITDKDGLHARPAGLLVKEAGTFSSKLTLTKGEKSADLRRLFAVMSLAVKQNETVTVTAEGEDEEKAAETLKKFFEENL